MTPTPRRTTRWTRTIRTAAIATVASIGLAACGLTAGDSFEFIPDDEIQFGLDQTTTTSTTTTTTLPADPPTDPPPTTTTTVTSPVQTAPVEVYFVIGLDQLQRQTLQLSFPLEPLQVLAQLEDGPPPDQGSVGLRTALRPNLTNGIENTDGVATIDLRRSVLNRTGPRDQGLAIAQLVLTVTRLPGVGQVRFTVDGEPLPIPVPPRFTLSEPGEPLTYAMFSVLLTSPNTPTTTTEALPPGPRPTPPPVITPPTTLHPGANGDGDGDGDPGGEPGTDPDADDDPGTDPDGDSDPAGDQ